MTFVWSSICFIYLVKSVMFCVKLLQFMLLLFMQKHFPFHHKCSVFFQTFGVAFISDLCPNHTIGSTPYG